MGLVGFNSVLVTGASGFVGRRFVAALRKDSGDAMLTLCGSSNAESTVGSHRLDLRDAVAVEELVALTRPDLVIHLAGQASVGQAACASAETWDVNFIGTFRLAQALRKHAPGATVFFTSSSDVYGEAYNDGVASEGGPLKPQSAYAHSKAAAEAMLASVLSDDARLIVVRPSNHSGAGQDLRFVLPSFAAQIAEAEAGLREPLIKVGDLNVERDFIHVDSVIDTYCQLLSKVHSFRARTILNVASGAPVRLRTLLDAMLRLSNLNIAVETDPERLRSSDIPRTLLATDRLREFGITPPPPADDRMLREVLESQRERLMLKLGGT